jgi:actin-like ATPase involved in cell morphogenesis
MSTNPNSSQGPIIGIDFGTTKTMVAEYDPAKRFAKVRKLGRGGDEMPTSMYVTDGGEVLFGDDADDEGIHDSSKHHRRFKMLLGKTTETQFGRRAAMPIDLAAEFLSHLRIRLESEVLHRPLEQVVLTVPAMFGQAQRKDLTKAAERAGFKNVELLAEPVAAGIAYCDHHTDLTKNLRFLVVDWGGGTFDLAVVERNEADECRALYDYVDGAGDIGGEDLDDELEIAVSEMVKSTGFQPLELQPEHELGKFRRELTRAKEGLSSKNQVTANFTLDGKLARIPLDQSRLEEIIHDKVHQGARQVAELVERCRKNGCKLDFILLAGGTSRIPMIPRLLEQSAGLPCRTWSEGRDAIALGAAIHAHRIQDSGTSVPISDPTSASDGAGMPSTLPEIFLPSVVIECPHCNEAVDGVSGTGEFVCPSCGGGFVVGCECPECGLEIEIEEWGTYSCPSKVCRCEFNAADCISISIPPVLIQCPHCATEVGDVNGTGDWICPSCGGGFVVGCECPECGLEIEIEKWGNYNCPSKVCRCEFNAADCITVSILPVSIDCPHCNEAVDGVSGTGEFVCPSCGGGFVVGCECPECSLEIEIEEWGAYRCPSKVCRCEFNAIDCSTVFTESVVVNTKNEDFVDTAIKTVSRWISEAKKHAPW